ncbi:MAG: lambda-exonuclease family protein [Bilifractor sp.]|jgi:putative phage-type endonuclease
MSIELKTYMTREDWLHHRRGIGGSDAAAVLGISPWKTNVQLWEEKTYRKNPPDISNKAVVRYGTEAEKYLRGLFALDYPEYEVGYAENNAVFNSDLPFAHASLDGWLTEKETGRKGILEIKTTNITSGMLADRWNEQIPMHYMAQVVHYFIVTGFDFAYLRAQLKFSSRIEIRDYLINREDHEEDIDLLLREEADFWNYVETDTCPPLKLNI